MASKRSKKTATVFFFNSHVLLVALLLLVCNLHLGRCFSVSLLLRQRKQQHSAAILVAARCKRFERHASLDSLEEQQQASTSGYHQTGPDDWHDCLLSTRREALLCLPKSPLWIAFTASTLGWTATPTLALSATSSTTNAEITDKIYLTIKGNGFPSSSSDQQSEQQQQQRNIVIGLFGKNAPVSVEMLKQLVSPSGLPAKCRPLSQRALQKEQLEANKVYNSCRDRESDGVRLQYSTIWRIRKDERIDIGAVTGRYVSREYPTWMEDEATTSSLRHDALGVVSVRRGNEGGFGFTIYRGNNSGLMDANQKQLDADHIVVGRVLDGLDLVQALNNIPVVASSSLNFMSLTGGPKTSNAPDRSCRYGGPMYCNENKPLIKLTVIDAGIL